MKVQEVIITPRAGRESAMIPDLDGLPRLPEALFAVLDGLNVPYTLYKHEAVFTNEEADFLKDHIPGLQTRNLFLRDKKERMLLLSKAEVSPTDLDELAAVTGYKRFSFGSADRLMRHLGVKPGSVCPYAIINDTDGMVESYLDAEVMKADLVGFHPLINTMTITTTPADLVRVLTHLGHPPKIISLASPHQLLDAA